jgi:prevent-host-death family protein
MGKIISATTLRNQLSNLLDELHDGETHFIIERNNEKVAVLLSMEKFKDIMQTLELLNTLEYIGTAGLEEDTLPDDIPDCPEPLPRPEGVPLPPRHSHRAANETLESVAAKLGIRVIK